MNESPSKKKLIHKIFILDAFLNKPFDEVNRNEKINKMIDQILGELKMEKLSPLVIDEATDSTAPGWTFIQPITTSHISAHYFFEEKEKSHIHFDLYSCKEFQWKTVLKIVNDYFDLGEWAATLIDRDQLNRSISDFKGFGPTQNN